MHRHAHRLAFSSALSEAEPADAASPVDAEGRSEGLSELLWVKNFAASTKLAPRPSADDGSNLKRKWRDVAVTGCVKGPFTRAEDDKLRLQLGSYFQVRLEIWCIWLCDHRWQC